MVSLPVLNPHTGINRDFDSFELMPSHNDMAAMVDRMHFDGDRPAFYLLNVGETHYPYALPDEDPKDWPRISGVHGVFKHLGDPGDATRRSSSSTRSSSTRCASARSTPSPTSTASSRSCSRCCPPNTWLVVTADHGELFGEEGYFGHGPVKHEKVLEVPFVEGLAP